MHFTGIFAVALVLAAGGPPLGFVTGEALAQQAQPDCKWKTFSAWPRRYGGVASCHRETRKMQEARWGCQAKAKEMFRSLPGVTFEVRDLRPPRFSVATTQRRECVHSIAGVCVNDKRVCTGEFRKLECTAFVCRTVASDF